MCKNCYNCLHFDESNYMFTKCIADSQTFYESIDKTVEYDKCDVNCNSWVHENTEDKRNLCINFLSNICPNNCQYNRYNCNKFIADYTNYEKVD